MTDITIIVELEICATWLGVSLKMVPILSLYNLSAFLWWDTRNAWWKQPQNNFDAPMYYQSIFLALFYETLPWSLFVSAAWPHSLPLKCKVCKPRNQPNPTFSGNFRDSYRSGLWRIYHPEHFRSISCRWFIFTQWITADPSHHNPKNRLVSGSGNFRTINPPKKTTWICLRWPKNRFSTETKNYRFPK